MALQALGKRELKEANVSLFREDECALNRKSFTGVVDDSSLSCKFFFSFAEVESIWRKFEREAASTPYQCYDWAEPFHENISSANCSILIVVVMAAKKPVAILPLSICNKYGVRICRWLGDSYANYQMPLFLPEATDGWTRADLMTILRQIADRTAVVAFDFTNQPTSWRGNANPFACLPHARSPSPAYAMPLSPDFDALASERRSVQSRQQQRRKRRNLEKAHGPTTFKRVETAEEFEHVLEAMIAHRRARFLQMGVPDVFSRKGVDSFLREAWERSQKYADSPILVIDYISCKDRILATYTGITHQKRYSCFINSIDPDVRLNRFSPGELLLAEVIRQRCAEGDFDLDLGIGVERYKQAWCEADTLIDSIVATRPIGHMFCAFRYCTRRVKRAIKNVPALWRLLRLARRSVAPQTHSE